MSLGPTSNGLKLEIIPEKTSYNEGDIPVFKAVITNISDHDILFCRYHLRHRLLSSLTGGGYEVFPFAPTPELPIEEKDLVNLKPGQSISETLDIKNEQHYEFLYGGKLPPRIPQTMALTGFPPGDYEFQVYVGKDILYNTSPEGTYSYSRKHRNIIKDVPKNGISADISKTWEGDMLAKCSVKIQ
jgi:hypothetical protein